MVIKIQDGQMVSKGDPKAQWGVARLVGATDAHHSLICFGVLIQPGIRDNWWNLEVGIPKVTLEVLEPFSFVVYVGFSKLLICFGKVPDALDNPKDPDQYVDW